ncbi:MAG: TonB-dependent receptor family protein, partial [Flavobacteriales bacterium]
RSADDARFDQRVELKLGRVSELSHETYAGLTDSDFAQTPYRRYAGSHRDEMDAGQEQAVLTHVMDLGGGWRWTNRAYATRFQRNWYKADRAAGASGDWVKLGPLLGSAVGDSTIAEALSVFRDGADGVVRLKANNRVYHSRGVESKVSWDGAWSGWRRFEASIRRHGDGMDRFQWVDDWTMASGQLIAPDRGTPGTESNRIEWSRATAGYLRGRWSQRGWSLIPGVRVEHILAGRDDYGTADVDRTGLNLQSRHNLTVAWLPGVGFQKDLGAEWSVFGGVHRGFLPPGSSQEVQPEFAWNQEAGVRWVCPRFEATAVAFAHVGRNLQGSDFASSGGSGEGDVYNGGTTRVAGVETQLDWTNGANPDEASRWELGLTYTFTDGRFTSAFDSDYEAWGEVEVGDHLPYLARHQGTVRVAWARGPWSVDASARSTEGMRTVAGQEPMDEGVTVGGSTVLDVTGRCHLGNGFALELGVRNLMDAVYVASARPAGLRPGLPRTITGGFNLAF